MAGRASQDAIEVLIAPTDEHARVSQDAVEVLVEATGASLNARISQDVIEVLLIPTVNVTVPSAQIALTGEPVVPGTAIVVPPAVLDLTPGKVIQPFLDTSFDIGGIGVWTHTRPFDIETDPLAWGITHPFDIGQTIGWVFENPFDVEGKLSMVHERPFDILGDTIAPEYGSHIPAPSAVAGLVLTAPTDGTNVLHVNDTTGVHVGQTAVIGAYTATVTGVGAGTVTLDRSIP